MHGENSTGGWITHADGTHSVLSAEEARDIIEQIERTERAEAAWLPDTETAIDVLTRAFHRLKALGWREIQYCPKDGTHFDVIEPGSTGIHDCRYEGKWPDGSWWIFEAGDIWPGRPILWRPRVTGTVMEPIGPEQPQPNRFENGKTP